MLRGMFPTITLRAVRLRVDPMNSTSRQVLVCEAAPERYEALRVGVPEAAWTEVPAGELIACLRTSLGR
ncbi:hypothetical protein C1N81_08005 [Streptomyces sp. SGAir0957]